MSDPLFEIKTPVLLEALKVYRGVTGADSARRRADSRTSAAGWRTEFANRVVRAVRRARQLLTERSSRRNSER